MPKDLIFAAEGPLKIIQIKIMEVKRINQKE